MMNSTNLIGNLTRDPELRYSESGKAFLKGNIAVQRRFNKEEADFIQFVMFGKGAEIFAQYTSKGSQVALEGRIQTGRYEDKDGKTIYTTDVIVDNYTFLGKTGESKSQDKPTKQQSHAQAQGEPLNIDDSSLPF